MKQVRLEIWFRVDEEALGEMQTDMGDENRTIEQFVKTWSHKIEDFEMEVFEDE